MNGKLRTFIAVLALSIAAPGLAGDYAPAPSGSPGGPGTPGQFLASLRENMPDVSRVEAPLYPGAIAVSHTGIGGDLPGINLVAFDPPSAIVAWYREKLTGWHVKSKLDLVWVFWKGKEEDYRPTSPYVPHVVIRESDGTALDEKLMSGCRARIAVFYNPAD